eukprot:1001436-Alexandrium_andersonii.AAC.1
MSVRGIAIGSIVRCLDLPQTPSPPGSPGPQDLRVASGHRRSSEAQSMCSTTLPRPAELSCD